MEKIRKFLQKPLVRTSLVVGIIVGTLVVFAYYLSRHPQTITTLLHLPPSVLGLLTIGYLATIAANAYVLHVSLRLLGKKAGFGDNVALTSYSSIVNFFGPLQSGPGVRAVYLKAKYQVRLRDFLATTILFYLFFALLNCLILAIAVIMRRPSIPIGLAIVAVALASACLLYGLYNRVPRFREALRSFKLHDYNFWLIGVGALGLIVATAFIYFVELSYVDPNVAPWQSLVYAAAANMALFVSLTPGAIGFREAFLVFTTTLHGIDTGTIFTASIIDRAFYIVFLLLLFVVLVVLGKRLGFSFFGKQTDQPKASQHVS